MGSSLPDLRRLPEPVQGVFGHALHLVQLAEYPPEARSLRGELGGLVELVDDFRGGTYRAVYSVKLQGAVYVLHVFQKKSNRGISTPRHEIALIKSRLARAKAHHRDNYGTAEVD